MCGTMVVYSYDDEKTNILTLSHIMRKGRMEPHKKIVTEKGLAIDMAYG